MPPRSKKPDKIAINSVKCAMSKANSSSSTCKTRPQATKHPALSVSNVKLPWRAAAAKREDGTWGATQRGESPRYVQARYPSTARSGEFSLLGYPPHALPLALTPATS